MTIKSDAPQGLTERRPAPVSRGLSQVKLAGVCAFALAVGLTGTAHAQGAAGTGSSQVLEEIQVTGTRIRRTTDFDTANPTTVVDDSYLHNLGIVNLGDAMIDIPSNVSTFTPQATGNANFFAGSTIANLRGINPYFGSRTLTLIDGRRHVPTNQGDSVDMNFIPSIILQRMDVVTGGASAAYGSGAISGVNNVILNHTLEGFKVDFDYGVTGHGDADNYHGAAAWGTQLFEGKSHLVLAGEYQKQQAASCYQGRAWCAESRGYMNNANTNPGNPSPSTATAQSPYTQWDSSQPHFYRATDIRNNGLSYNGVFWNSFVPGSGNSQMYQATADGTGTMPFNIGSPAGANTNAFGSVIGGDGLPTTYFNNLIGETERYTLNGHFDYDITDSIHFSVDGEYGKVKTDNPGSALASRYISIYDYNPYLTGHPDLIAAQLAGQIYPAGALYPGSPAGQAFFNKDWTSQLNAHSTFDTEVYSIAADLNGKISDTSWTWDAYVTHGHTHRVQNVWDNPHLNALNMALDAVYPYLDPTNPGLGVDTSAAPVCHVTRDGTGILDPLIDPTIADGCVPINPFGTAALTQAQHDYGFGYLQEDEYVNQTVAAANVSGDLFDGFGAGPVGLAVGGEYRWENINNVNNSAGNKTDYLIQYGDSFKGKVNVWEVYGEVNVPVLADMPFAQRLEFDGAVRYSEYKNTGQGPIFDQATNDLTTWKISGFWDPFTWLRIRGSQSRDSRAGNFRELYYGQVLHAGGIFGYCAAGNQDPCDIVLQGNPAVKPEKSDTSTIGVVLTPGGKLDGLQFAADYYRIKLKNGITPAGGQTQDLIAQCRTAGMDCSSSLGSVVFDPDSVAANPTDSSTWTVATVTDLAYNARQYQVKGIDFSLNYNHQFDNGDSMNIRAIATKTISQKVETAIGIASREIVGQTGAANGFLPDFQSSPDWVGNLSFTYNSGGFSGTIQGRYIAPGTYDFYGIQPGDVGFRNDVSYTYDNNTIPFYQIYTLNLTYTFDNFMGSDSSLQVFGNVNNLFDVDPPFGGSAVYYDQLGRRFRVGARLSF